VGFPNLKKVRKVFHNDDRVKFLAVQTVFEGHATNTKTKLKPTQDKYGLDIPMGHDDSIYSSLYPVPDTMMAYRSGGTPWTVIIGPDGKVAFNHFHIKTKDAIALINKLITIN